MIEIVSDLIENIMGKGENTGYQHFLMMFLRGLFLRFLKSQVCVVTQRVKHQCKQKQEGHDDPGSLT